MNHAFDLNTTLTNSFVEDQTLPPNHALSPIYFTFGDLDRPHQEFPVFSKVFLFENVYLFRVLLCRTRSDLSNSDMVRWWYSAPCARSGR